LCREEREDLKMVLRRGNAVVERSDVVGREEKRAQAATGWSSGAATGSSGTVTRWSSGAVTGSTRAATGWSSAATGSGEATGVELDGDGLELGMATGVELGDDGVELVSDEGGNGVVLGIDWVCVSLLENGLNGFLGFLLCRYAKGQLGLTFGFYC
jgi:hypothetical protein